MKTKKSKILSLLFIMIMVISMMPMSVFAVTQANPKIFSVLIIDANGNHIDVSTLNFDNSKGINEAITQESGTIPTGGSFTYDADTYTLTIKDANIRHISASCWSNDTKSVFNLKFVGKNVITQKDENPTIHISPNTNITFADGATLDIHTDSSFGIVALGIHCGLNLTITGGKINILDSGFLGIATLNGDLNLKNTEINISVKDGVKAAGIYLDKYEDGVNGTLNSTNSKLNIKAYYPAINAGSINLTKTEANLVSTNDAAIYVNVGNIEVNNAKLNATAKSHAGLFADNGDIIVSGANSNITVNSKWPALNGKNVTIQNAQANLTSTDDVTVFASEGDVTFEKANVIANAPQGKKAILSRGDKILIDGVVKKPEEINADYFTLADYSKVEEQENLIPQELKDYTKESVDALNVAKSNIKLGLDFTHQEEVNKMAKELENAIKGLKLRPADYSKVREQLDLIPVDLDNYSDESVKALNDIKDNINYNLDFKHQSEVDKIEKNLEKAISELKHKTVKLIVNNLEGTKSTPSGEIIVNRGSNNEISISVEKGYKLISVKVNDVEKIKELKDGKLKLENVIEDKNIVITAEKENTTTVETDKKEEKENKNPQTSDNIAVYFTLLGLGVIGMVSGLVYLKKKD